MKLEKYGNLCTFLTSNKKWARRKKGGKKLNRIMFLSLSFPSLAAISPLWHSSCCVFFWDMDLDAPVVTAHSAHSSVVRSPLLDVEQIDLKCWLFEGHISQLLAGSSPPPTATSLRVRALPPHSRPHLAAASQDTSWRGPPGRVVPGSVSKSDCTVADQRCNVSPRGDAQSAQTRLRVRDRETERIHR